MKTISQKIGKNTIFQNVFDDIDNIISPEKVLESWDNNFKIIPEDLNKNIKGFRTPQRGALYSIKAHWTVSNLPATIVMPTGTGKTETMIATILSEKCKKVLIVVPSNLLRKQTTEKCLTLGILKDFNLINNKLIHPVVSLVETKPSNLNELKEIIEKSNIIVTTITLLSGFTIEYFDLLIENCTELFIDEAHHIVATTWNKVKIKFNEKRILQFTATPFRNDGKKIDGKIIYNFPLSLAQKEGYFQKIQFQSLMEFDQNKADLKIAQAAINALKKDLKNGFKHHTVLVRSSSIKQAKNLYENIYSKYFQEYKPVLITSKTKKNEKINAMLKIKQNKSKILVCVDMFGEGIDIPSLKIAAIHDKYKSLPITLQFIGRFARSKEGLGSATVIANIADENTNECLEELYSQDSDWNKMLVQMSSSAIDKEIDLQELSNGFNTLGLDDINISNLRLKVSMIPYKTTCYKWNWKKWTTIFNIEKSRCSKNDEKNIIIIIVEDESKIDWSTDKNVNNINYQLYILYWNKKKKMVYINSSDKTINDKLVEAIFPGSERIIGETIFRCLSDIHQLKLGQVGLKTAIEGPIRYKMYAGLDIGEGIAESQKKYSTKSNLFGIGFDGNGKVSIGCSYKGKIWSRWVESIDYWMRWCDKTADKLLDDRINIKDIFKGTLIPNIIDQRPIATPISIEWPDELVINTEDTIIIKSNFAFNQLYNVDISLIPTNKNEPLRFYVESSEFREEYELVFTENNFSFTRIDSQHLLIVKRTKEMPLVDFFKQNPPLIRFSDQSTLEGNLYTKIDIKNRVSFNKNDIQQWNWQGIDIQKESQTQEKIKNSIQFKVISTLKNKSCYSIIFDDDDTGEIADVIAIKDIDNKITIEFYHCKFSLSSTPGSRVDDLYVLCGQAQKSIYWKQDGKAIINKMRKRETNRLSRDGISRFELGNIQQLVTIRNKISKFGFKLKIYIVQPGVDSLNMSDSVNDLLCCTKNYCLETYGVSFNLICS